MPYKDHQGHLEMYITNAIRGNNKEIVRDCVEACGDCTGSIRLCRLWKGCVGELELVMMCIRLHRSLQGYADNSKVTL